MDERQAISDLEAEIEELRDAAERCRKIAIAAKVAIVTGAAVFLLAFIQSSPLALVIGIAALLGSIALLGSNDRTLRELLVQIKARQARRSEMIDRLELHEVEPESVRSIGSGGPNG